VKPLIPLGHVVATPGALAAIGVSGDDLSSYLARHQSGDWGAIDAHDRKENNFHLKGIPADVRVHTQYYPGQDLDNYGSRPFVYVYCAARGILMWAQGVRRVLRSIKTTRLRDSSAVGRAEGDLYCP
jgi:hypothetical protein